MRHLTQGHDAVPPLEGLVKRARGELVSRSVLPMEDLQEVKGHVGKSSEKNEQEWEVHQYTIKQIRHIYSDSMKATP